LSVRGSKRARPLTRGVGLTETGLLVVSCSKPRSTALAASCESARTLSSSTGLNESCQNPDSKNGLEVIAAQEFSESWNGFAAQVGGVYDSVTGQPDPKKYQAVRDFTSRELSTHTAALGDRPWSTGPVGTIRKFQISRAATRELAVLPDAVEDPALARFGKTIECRDLIGRQLPSEGAGVLLGLRCVLCAGDRNCPFANQPIQRDLRRRLAAVLLSAPSKLGNDRLDFRHWIGREITLTRRRIRSGVLARQTSLAHR